MTNKPNGVIVLGYGPQPMDFISKASKIIGKDAVIEQDIGRMAGADFVFGCKPALDELRKRLEIGAFTQQCISTPGLSTQATNWLANGRRGISSNTIFTTLTGVDALNGSRGSHPRDPADLDRCLALLNEVPELRPLLPNMATVSTKWAALIANWDEIERCHLDEVGLGWSKGNRAEMTYALMQKTLDSVKEAI